MRRRLPAEDWLRYLGLFVRGVTFGLAGASRPPETAGESAAQWTGSVLSLAIAMGLYRAVRREPQHSRDRDAARAQPEAEPALEAEPPMDVTRATPDRRMTGRALPAVRRFNPWCEHRPLRASDQAHFSRAAAYLGRKDLSPAEQAAFYFGELTSCDGFEFVAFSNARLEEHVTLAGGVILVPCFLRDDEMRDSNDPLVQATVEMARRSRFVYDGWVPVTWEPANVRAAIRAIDEGLALFSLRGRISWDWQPKYKAEQVQSAYRLERRHLDELEHLAQLLSPLPTEDRRAVYRSIAWLSQSLRLSEPAARFLFAVLAVESLATYIEAEADDDSRLVSLRVSKETKAERRTTRTRCIQDTLAAHLAEDPTRAIQRAYFDCVVPIQRRLRAHVDNVFGADKGPASLLFDVAGAGKPLYDLRHEVAHGTSDALSEPERQLIASKVYEAENIARRYVQTVIQRALGGTPFTEPMTARMPLDLRDMVASSPGARFVGPTHMALIH